MRFRTWTGPLAVHCHNVEHEDMRMMFNFEPVMRLTGPQPGSDAGLRLERIGMRY